MLQDIEVVLGLLGLMTLLVAFANYIKISYPILLVLTGLGIGFVPGLPKITLEPDVVFVLFLPPILQYSAFLTPIRDFRANARSIGLLAIGLVLATTVAIAVVAHLIIGLPWAAAFVLGAIIAPPDAVAATAIAERLHLPRRIVTVLEGESLLNDATALVAYRTARDAIVLGSFSIWLAGGQFLMAAIGGIAVGVVLGLVLTPLFRRLTDEIAVYVILTFLSGYTAYLIGDTLGVSGVLAVIALGLFYTIPRYNTMTVNLRMQAFPIWDVLTFLINGLIFLLIGLQLRGITESLTNYTFLELIWYAAAICLTAILIRFAWVFPGTYLPRMPRKVRERDPFPPWQHTLIVAWTGMRGIVSLASALAIPLTIQDGSPFPGRDLIIFLTFSVILVTLVIQGLSLPLLIKVLKVKDDGGAEREENKARLVAARAGRERLNQLAISDGLSTELVKKLGSQYDKRITRFSARYKGEENGESEQKFMTFEHLQADLLKVEQEAVIELRNKGVINDEVLRRVQHDLDLERVRLRDGNSL